MSVLRRCSLSFATVLALCFFSLSGQTRITSPSVPPTCLIDKQRPPDGCVRARLRIRLLRWMSGIEACVRIRM